jgi:adenylosuccinate lyase
LGHFSSKLQISRLQRDLSDSTVLRQVGTGFAHSLISYESTLKGLKKLSVNELKMQEELNAHWEVRFVCYFRFLFIRFGCDISLPSLPLK